MDGFTTGDWGLAGTRRRLGLLIVNSEGLSSGIEDISIDTKSIDRGFISVVVCSSRYGWTDGRIVRSTELSSEV